MTDQKDEQGSANEPTLLEIEGEDEPLPAFLRGARGEEQGNNDDGSAEDNGDETSAGDAPQGDPARSVTPGAAAAEKAAPEGGTLGKDRFGLKQPPARRQPVKSTKEFFNDEVFRRIESASAHLRTHLTGMIKFEISDNAQRYTFDWRGEKLVSGESQGLAQNGASAPSIHPECTIRISENNFLRIAGGDLNPQVAMLTDKVKATGSVDLAIYFFNLLAPPAYF